jgi:hypothetical protein
LRRMPIQRPMVPRPRGGLATLPRSSSRNNSSTSCSLAALAQTPREALQGLPPQVFYSPPHDRYVHRQHRLPPGKLRCPTTPCSNYLGVELTPCCQMHHGISRLPARAVCRTLPVMLRPGAESLRQACRLSSNNRNIGQLLPGSKRHGIGLLSVQWHVSYRPRFLHLENCGVLYRRTQGLQHALDEFAAPSVFFCWRPSRVSKRMMKPPAPHNAIRANACCHRVQAGG